MRYVLGVDGGGTKTHCVLYDADTGRLDMLPWGPSDHERLAGGFSELRGVLQGMFRTLLNRNNISMDDIEFGVLGIGGLDTDEHHRTLSGVLTDLGLTRFHLCNDAYLGIIAGSPSGTGICAVNGTGCCVTGFDSSGGTVQIGGLGSYTGDLGGSSMLVPRTVGMVYDQLFREAPFTALTTAMFRWLDITDRHDFIETLTARFNADNPKAMFEVCKILFTAAAEGDETALKLLEASGEAYAGAIAGAINELSFAPDERIEIVFAGSLFAKGECDRIQKKAEERLLKRFPRRNLGFTTLTVPCVAGAVLWALKEIGIAGQRESVLRGFRILLP